MLTLKLIEHKYALDISNNKSIREDSKLVEILLKDRTTRKNIIWATDSYIAFGKGFLPKDNIQMKFVRNGISDLIKPRAEKVKYEQVNRTRDSAEVFTPTWIIKKQNDLIESELTNLPLQEFVNTKWLEVACGEGPYIASRYDTVTGETLELDDRVGFLDRKIQRVSKEVHEYNEWINLVEQAYKSTFGYEYQGDSLYLARENLLYTLIDYHFDKFDEKPGFSELKKIAEIISYNIFQMDGLNYNIPLSEEVELRKMAVQLNLFSDEDEVETVNVIKEGINVKIKNWSNNRLIEFKSFLEGNDMNMKFDVVIGNPPYQMEVKDTRAKQIYPEFMDSAFSIGHKVSLITPGRFLFDAGATPKEWNRKMLSDENLKVIDYRANSTDFFTNVDIKGGVAITYHDSSKIFGAINLFIPNEKVRSILNKVETDLNVNNFSDIVYTSVSYQLTQEFHVDNPKESATLPKHRNMLTTNIFDKFPNLFLKKMPKDNNKYIRVIGRKNNKRVIRWAKKEYVRTVDNFDYWKVLLAKSNGSGELGEILSSPFLGEPGLAHSQTFISIGNFSNKNEANFCLKYIKTKFTRTLLGILKVTQDNPPRVWEKIPLQDFSLKSDIDWSQTVSNIDKQLYEKYKLSEEEINFIETNVKEME